jgi:hypothetical protein
MAPSIPGRGFVHTPQPVSHPAARADLTDGALRHFCGHPGGSPRCAHPGQRWRSGSVGVWYAVVSEFGGLNVAENGTVATMPRSRSVLLTRAFAELAGPMREFGLGQGAFVTVPNPGRVLWRRFDPGPLSWTVPVIPGLRAGSSGFERRCAG